MPLSLTKEKKAALARFLERRNLKDGIVDLLVTTVKSQGLKRGDLTQDKNSTYATLVENLVKAVDKGWISLAKLTALLSWSEVAGRQHVCLYQLPQQGVKGILDDLSAPSGLDKSAATIDDFLDVPKSAYAQLLVSSQDEVLVKIVTPRHYWLSEVDAAKSTADDKWVHKWLVKERSAIILKCDKAAGVLQIRIPPRERQTQSETGKSIHDFVWPTLQSQYDMGNGSWFSKLKKFPITDAYGAILDNKKDFVLRHDTPESDTAKTRVSKLGSITELKDLRDDEMWDFADGYARKTMRGTWIVSKDNLVYAHLNFDKVRLSQKEHIEFARVFFPHLATDAEVEHVIKRIREHL